MSSSSCNSDSDCKTHKNEHCECLKSPYGCSTINPGVCVADAINKNKFIPTYLTSSKACLSKNPIDKQSCDSLCGEKEDAKLHSCDISEITGCCKKVSTNHDQSKTILNPQVLTNKYSTTWKDVKDGRLVHGLRGRIFNVGQAPIEGSVNIETLSTNKDLNHYGHVYKSYNDISAGQIMYYIDNDNTTEDSFYPLYTNLNKSGGVLYKDPMGTVTPFYKYKHGDNSKQHSKCDNTFSWIHDSNNHRDEYIAAARKSLFTPSARKTLPIT